MNRLKHAVLKEAQAKEQLQRAEKHKLQWIEIEITRRCPLACLHCGSSCDERQFYDRELSESEILTLLERIKTAYGSADVMVCFTGGEPLMRRDLFRIIAKTTEMGFRATMVSNGMLLGEEQVKLLAAAGLSTITISLDGLEENHNRVRGHSGSFRRALNALRLLQHSNYFHTVEALSCVNRQTLEELADIRQLLHDNGIEHWRVTRIFPIGRALDYPELLLNRAQLIRLLDFVKEQRKQNPGFISYGEEGYLGCKYDFAVREGMQHCDAGISIMTILADGSIIGCAAVDHRFIQGNIKRDDPVDVWENRFVPYRNREWMKTGICGGCSKFRYCRGDGMHLWSPGNPDPAQCAWKTLHPD